MTSIYEDMRARVLELTPDDLGPGAEDSPVLGVVMDMGYPEGTASIIGLADGSTSMYHSGGGGIIGGGEHPQVAGATLRWVAKAAELADRLEPAAVCPLPVAGMVQFVVIAPNGRLCAAAPEDRLADGDHPLSPLFAAGHDVITELRFIDEAAG